MELKKKIQKTLWLGTIFLLLLIVPLSFLFMKNDPKQTVSEITHSDSQANSLMADSAHNFTDLTIGATEVSNGCTSAVKNASVPSYVQTSEPVDGLTEYFIYKDDAYVLLTSTNISTLLYENGVFTEDTAIDWEKTYYLDDQSSVPAVFYVLNAWIAPFWDSVNNKVKSTTDLIAVDADHGNFFKKTANQTGGVARDGTSASKAFVISNATELAFLGAVITARGNSAQNTNFPLNDKYFALDYVNDVIDLSGKAWTPLVNITNSNVTKIYFDGGNHTITGAVVDQSDLSSFTTSIFGYFPQGEISNLTITNSCVRGNTRAAVVANTNNGTTLKNILVQNSYVSSKQNTAGVIYNGGNNLNKITNCRIENCEVETLGFGVNHINNGDTYYTMGIGRSNDISLTENLKNTAIVKNSIIHYTEELDAYAPLTTSPVDNIHVYGVGCSVSSNSADIGNFNLENNKVFANVTIKDSTGNAGTDYRILYFRFYVYGGYYYSHGGQNDVSIHDITMTNCYVDVDLEYLPESEDNTKNGNMLVYVDYCYVAGIARMSNAGTNVTHYKNLLVQNCTIKSKINMEPIRAPSVSNGQNQRSFQGKTYVQGVFFADSAGQIAENCKIMNSKVAAQTSFKNNTSNSGASFTSTVYVNGVGGSGSIDTLTNYVKCSSTNCQFDAIISETFKEEDDPNRSVNNSFSNDISLAGIGRGRFLKDSNNNPCSVYNVLFNAKSNVIRGENDSTSSCGSTVRAVGIGYNVSNNDGDFQGATIEKATFDVEGKCGDATTPSNKVGSNYVSTIGYSQSSSTGYKVSYTNVQTKNVAITATGFNNYIAGQAYASKPLSNSLEITDCVVDNLRITTDSKNDSYVSGLLYNTSTNAGLTVQNSTVKNCNISSNSTGGNVYAAGMVLQTSSTNGLNTTIKDCYAIDNNILAEFKTGGTGNDKTVGAYGLAGYYIKSVDSCVVTNGTVSALNAVGYAYAEGIAGTWGFANSSISGHYTARPSSATSEPLTSITNSYNFADVKAITEGTSSTGASGIGQAEYIDSCVNYGKVMGNYVGGITRGFFNGNNSDNAIYSTILIVKNCTNAGDVCRADTSGNSYIGGIVGVYYNYSYYRTANTKFILENNTSMGGVYSKLQNGTYSQNLSPTTYLGTLYGFLRIRTNVNSGDESAYETVLSKCSIKNNYSLVEENGFNGNLYRSETPTGAILAYTKNIPRSNYMTSSDGVFYHDGGNYENSFRALYKYCATVDANHSSNTNTIFSSNPQPSESRYTTNFAISNDLTDYATANHWKQMSLNGNVYPQVNIELAKQVVMFDLNGYEGTTPNVIIANVSDGNFTFDIPNADIELRGAELKGWRLKGASSDYDSENIEKQNYLMTFYARVDLINYKISFITTDTNKSWSYTVGENNDVAEADTRVTIETTNIILYSSYTTDNDVSLITWKVKDGDSDNFIVKAVNPTSLKTNNSFSLDISSFIQYANYVDSEYEIVFDVEYDEELRFTITIENAAGGESAYTWSARVGTTDVVVGENEASVREDNTVNIVVTPNNYYSFTQYQIDEDSAVDIVPADNNTITISSITANHIVKIKVEKIKYDLNIYFENLEGISISSRIEDSIKEVLISDFNDLPQMSVDTELPQLQGNNYPGYRFVGWKLRGMQKGDYISSTDGIIDREYIISATDFHNYLETSNMVTRFNIIAVVQRRYTLNITMDNPTGDSFASTFTLGYTDENGEPQTLTNVTEETVITLDENGNEVQSIVEHKATEWSHEFDEDTYIEIEVEPNKRVQVSAFSGIRLRKDNTGSITLRENQDVMFKFDTRALSIDREAIKIDVDKDGYVEVEETTLIGATVYSVVAGDVVLEDSNNKINIGNTLRLSYNSEMLEAMNYRFIGVYLKNITTEDVYDTIENNEIIVDDAFFDNYVTDDGHITVMIKAIKQYKVIITGENLISTDNYTLGSYDVVIKDINDNVLDNSSVTYTENKAKEDYLLDIGLSVIIKPTVLSNYASFAGYSGVFEAELAANGDAKATISSNRAISVRFVKNTYSIDTKFDAAVGGTLSTTQTFQLGDTIVISYTPANNYQILDWKLADKKLSDLGAVREGNTIKVVATEEFLSELKQLGLFEGDTITLKNDLKTMMNPTMFYGLIGGGILIVILAAIITLLLVRQAKLKRAKLEQERKLNDIARKFNIAGMISDLKSGKTPDAYTSSTDKKSK